MQRWNATIKWDATMRCNDQMRCNEEMQHWTQMQRWDATMRRRCNDELQRSCAGCHWARECRATSCSTKGKPLKSCWHVETSSRADTLLVNKIPWWWRSVGIEERLSTCEDKQRNKYHTDETRHWIQPPQISEQYFWWCAGFCLPTTWSPLKRLPYFYSPGGMLCVSASIG